MTDSVPPACAKPPLRCTQAGESAADNDGVRLKIEHKHKVTLNLMGIKKIQGNNYEYS